MPTPIPSHRLAALLERAARSRIGIIGDAMLDVYLEGDVERISPEAPVPVVRVHARRCALGGAANVAQNVRATRASATLVGVTGRDAAGRTLRQMLAGNGVLADGFLECTRPTTTKTRLLARAQQVVRFDEEDDRLLDGREAALLRDAAERVAREVDVLVLEDYNKGVLAPSVITAAIAVARDRGIPIVVDPKYRHFFAYRGATVFKPNRRELEAALGAAVDLDRPASLPAVLSQLGVQHLLLTLGEHGMVLVNGDGTLERVPTTARAVYDVVGAGDTVTAYLAVMLAAGATVREAAVIANYAAGVEVEKLGAATVTPAEVLAAHARVTAGVAAADDATADDATTDDAAVDDASVDDSTSDDSTSDDSTSAGA